MYCRKRLGQEEAKRALEVTLVIALHSSLLYQVVQTTMKGSLRNNTVFSVSDEIVLDETYQFRCKSCV